MANGDDAPAPATETAKPGLKKYRVTDKKTGDTAMIWGPAENPDQAKLFSAAQNIFAKRRQFNPVDLLQSIPRGAVKGFFSLPSLASELGKPEVDILSQAATGAPSGVPAQTAEQMTSQIETAAGYEMHKPQTRGGRVGERIGEVAGDPTSWIGPGGFFRKALSATIAGVGSAEGERFGRRYGHPQLGAVIGGATGGAVGGFGGGARGLPGRVPREIRERTTEDALKDASQQAYGQLAQFQYKLRSNQAADLTRAIKQYLATGENTSFTPYLAEKTYRTLDEMLTKARTVAAVERVRQVLNQTRIEGGNEALASSKAIEALDDYLLNLPGVAGVAEAARKNWAAYKRGQIVEETVRRGVERANTSGKGGGANVVNTIKQEFARRIRNKPEVWRNFTKEEKEQIDLIIDPGRSMDVAQWMANFAPRNPITGAIGLFAGAHITMDPMTQLAILGTGEVAHRFTKRMGLGRAERVLEATRARSPAGGYYTPRPAVPAPMRAGYGAARALGATALSPEASEAIELPEIKVTPQ
jgi:hypothetical protein